MPADVRDLADSQRAALVEAVAEADDRLLEKYLESGELCEAEVREGLVRAIRDQNRRDGGSQTLWFLRTHPLDSKRIDQLKSWLPEAQAEFKKP